MPVLVTLSSKLHAATHWALTVAGFLLVARNDLPAALQFLPADSTWPKYLGYVLALAAFSRIIGAAAGAVPPGRLEPAAPSNVIPISEAITAVDKPGAVRKDE